MTDSAGSGFVNDLRVGYTRMFSGNWVVPVFVYLKGNRIKVELALAQGRKLHDKRERERERTLDREAGEVFRGRRRLRADASGEAR